MDTGATRPEPIGEGDRLDEYRSRRDFGRTDEPSGDSDRQELRRFVIQHHDASSEHYDVRLEHDGVLLSWAVPKGPSTDPRDKRLAVRTEDHPVDYLDFEGTIPEDQYGGGSVIVWDTGGWEPIPSGTDGAESDAEPSSVDDALTSGHLRFRVEGQKIRGTYVLQRFRGDDEWLLIKQRDDDADARRRPTSTQPESVLTGRTVEEAAADDGSSEDGDDD